MKTNAIQLNLFPANHVQIPTAIAPVVPVEPFFDTTIRQASAFLTSLIPNNISDNAMFAAYIKNGQKAVFHFINGGRKKMEAFFQKRQNLGFDKAKIFGEVGKIRQLNNLMATSILQECGFSVDRTDRQGFLPDFPKNTYFAIHFPTVYSHNFETIQGKKNKDTEISFSNFGDEKRGHWIICQYVAATNENCGDDVANLLFRNSHFLEANASDYIPELKNDDYFKALIDLGYIKEVGDDVVEAYKEFKRYHFLAEYKIARINTTLTLFKRGNEFYCTADSYKLTDIVYHNFKANFNDKELKELALKLLEQYTNIELVKGDDVLKIGSLKANHREMIRQAANLLPKHIRDIYQRSENKFLKLQCYYCDTPETLANRLEQFISFLVEQAENALTDAANAKEYIDNILLMPWNKCSRVVFGVVANVSVSHLENMNKEHREKWFEAFLVKRFGEKAFSDALVEIAQAQEIQKQVEAEQKQEQEVLRAAERVKSYFNCLKSWYRDIVLNLEFCEKMRGNGKIQTWYYANDTQGTYIVAKRDSSYKDFHDFIKEAINTYGSVHRALVALGVKSSNEVDMTKLSNPNPLILEIPAVE